MKKLYLVLILLLSITIGLLGINSENQAFAEESAFQIDENGVLTAYTGSDAEVTIPENVVTIGQLAFNYNENVVKVILPEKCTKIEGGAFIGCNKLSSINLEKIESIGDQAFEGCAFETLHISSSIKSLGTGAFALNFKLLSVTMDDGIEIIGNSAFNQCYSLKTIEIPSTLLTIGSRAFQGTSIQSLEFPEGTVEIANEVAMGVNSLTSVKLPSTVVNIGNQAFSMTSLTEINFPSSLVNIGGQAFSYTQIKKIALPATLETIGFDVLTEGGVTYYINNFAFNGCPLEEITIAEGAKSIQVENNAVYTKNYESLIKFAVSSTQTSFKVNENTKRIEENAFDGAMNIQSVVLNNKLEIINYNAFANCNSLTEIEIPSSVKAIMNGAFMNDSSLNKVVLNEGLETLGTTILYNGVFENCSALEALKLPKSLLTLGNATMRGCSMLKEFTIPACCNALPTELLNGCLSLENIFVDAGNSAFTSENGILFADGGKTLVLFPMAKKVYAYEISDKITAIASNAFYGNTNLLYVSVPASVKEMGESVFSDCTSLARIDFNAELERIPAYTFANTNISEIMLPSTVKYIGDYAFFSTALSTITLSETLIGIGSQAFSNSKITELYLPDSIAELGWGIAQNCKQLSVVRFPATMSVLPGSLFYGSDQISQVILPEGVTTIPSYFIAGSVALISFDIPASVTTIGSGWGTIFGDSPNVAAVNVNPENKCFKSIDGILYDYDMTKLIYYPAACPLTEYIIPDTISELPVSAFENNKTLKKVVLPSALKMMPDRLFNSSDIEVIILNEGLEAFGSNAFGNCYNLRELIIPSTVKTLGMATFENCTALTEITLPDGVSLEGTYSLFQNCTSLRRVNNMPKTSNVLPQYFFANCTALEEAYLPDGISILERNIFENCTSLKSITIPASVLNIEPAVFNGATSLVNVIMLPKTAPELLHDMFSEGGNVQFNAIEGSVLYIVDGATGYTEGDWANWFKNVKVIGNENPGAVTINAIQDDKHNLVLELGNIFWAETIKAYDENGNEIAINNGKISVEALTAGKTYSYKVVASLNRSGIEINREAEIKVEIVKNALELAQEAQQKAEKEAADNKAELEKVQTELSQMETEKNDAVNENKELNDTVNQLRQENETLVKENTQLKAQNNIGADGYKTGMIISIIVAVIALAALVVIIITKKKA